MVHSWYCTFYGFQQIYNDIYSLSGSVGKESACNAGDTGDEGLIPGSGRSSKEENYNLLQYSCLKNPWSEEPGRLQSKGWQKVKHIHSLSLYLLYRFHWKSSVLYLFVPPSSPTPKQPLMFLLSPWFYLLVWPLRKFILDITQLIPGSGYYWVGENVRWNKQKTPMNFLANPIYTVLTSVEFLFSYLIYQYNCNWFRSDEKLIILMKFNFNFWLEKLLHAHT